MSLEVRLILPFNYRRKGIFKELLKVGPLSSKIKRSGAFNKQMLLPVSKQRPAGTAGFVNIARLFIGAAHPNLNLPLFKSGLFTAVQARVLQPGPGLQFITCFESSDPEFKCP